MQLVHSVGHGTPVDAASKAVHTKDKVPDHEPFEGIVYGDEVGKDQDIAAETTEPGTRRGEDESHDPARQITAPNHEAVERPDVTSVEPIEHADSMAADPDIAAELNNQGVSEGRRTSANTSPITAMEQVLSHKPHADRATSSRSNTGVASPSLGQIERPTATPGQESAAQRPAHHTTTGHQGAPVDSAGQGLKLHTTGETVKQVSAIWKGNTQSPAHPQKTKALRSTEQFARPSDASASGKVQGESGTPTQAAVAGSASDGQPMRGQAPDSAGSLRPDPGHPTLSAAKAAKHSQETLPESKSSEGMLHAKTTEISPVAQTKPMPQALAHTTIAAQLMKAQTSTALSTAPESVQGLEEFAWDVRPNGTSPLAHGAPMVQRAEIPQHLSQAIAQVFQRAPDKPVEIALNPIELGRVRLVMTTQETGITITVSAERGDTLELMRRNIDDLGQSLSDLGFEDVSFAFEQHRQGADQRDPAADDTGDLPRIEETLVLHSAKSQINTLSNRLPTGIDMRL